MCIDLQGMNIRHHHFMQRIEYASVSLETRLTRKRLGHDINGEVSLAITRPGMTRVQVALILYKQFGRCEILGKDILDPFAAFCGHGKRGLNGFTTRLS